MKGRVSLGHSNHVHYSGFDALWRYSYQHCWYLSINCLFSSLVVLAELTLFLLHNFSYFKFSKICLKRGKTFFLYGFNFCRLCSLENVRFWSMRTICVLHSILELFEASKPEWSHESFILSLLDSWHCGIYTDCSFYFLVVLSSKLRYILTGFFFLQAVKYVFAIFFEGFWLEKPRVNIALWRC